MNNETLFNGQPDFREPDWSEFIALEAQPVVDLHEPGHPHGTFCEAVTTLVEAWDFHGIYARTADGPAELITDVPKGEDVRAVLEALSQVSGLPVALALINDRDIPKNPEEFLP